MSRIFFNSNRQETDILHSVEFNSKSFKERADFAFNKDSYKNLSTEDKMLLRGYASCLAEKQRAYRYNHPKKDDKKNNKKK